MTVLRTRRDHVLARWVAAVVGRTGGCPDEAERELAVLYDAVVCLVDGTTSEAARGLAGDKARALLAELSAARARRGATPAETAASVFALKDAVLAELGGAAVDAGFVAFSRTIDELGLVGIETAGATREALLAEQAEQLLELSTPVVKLWEGVVAVPLVGTLDAARTQAAMEKLLQTLVETGSAHAIIDVTGVPAFDAQVARHLLKTVVAARLVGATCIVSGIRPRIASEIAALGIEFGDIATKATFADALVAALRRSGAEVVRRPGRG